MWEDVIASCLSLPQETSWVGGRVGGGDRRLPVQPSSPGSFSGSGGSHHFKSFGGIVSGSKKHQARPHPAAAHGPSTCPAGPRAGVHSLGWGHPGMEENKPQRGFPGDLAFPAWGLSRDAQAAQGHNGRLRACLTILQRVSRVCGAHDFLPSSSPPCSDYSEQKPPLAASSPLRLAPLHCDSCHATLTLSLTPQLYLVRITQNGHPDLPHLHRPPLQKDCTHL